MKIDEYAIILRVDVWLSPNNAPVTKVTGIINDNLVKIIVIIIKGVNFDNVNIKTIGTIDNPSTTLKTHIWNGETPILINKEIEIIKQ